MEVEIEHQMSSESLRLLRRAPGSSNQAVHVCSQHRCRVVEREERVKARALELGAELVGARIDGLAVVPVEDLEIPMPTPTI